MTRRPSPLWLVPFAGLLLSACPQDPPCGAGTVWNGSECTAALDGGTAGGGGDGGFDVKPGDALLVDTWSPGGKVELFALTQYCFSGASILRADGTLVPIAANDPALSVVIGNSALAMPSEPGDCPGVGLIGLAEGTTTATLVLRGQGQTLSSSVQLRVLAGTLAMAGGTVSLPVGGEADLSIGRCAAPPGGTCGGFPLGSDLVWRWLSVSAAEPSIARFSPPVGSQPWIWRVHGLAKGKTRAVFQYGPPGQAITIDPGSDNIQVTGTGTFSSFTQIGVRRGSQGCYAFYTGGAGNNCELQKDLCYTPYVRADFVDDQGAHFEADVTSGVTWSSLGDGELTSGSPLEYCASAYGEAHLRACVSGKCLAFGAPVLASGEVTGLQVNPSSVTVKLPQDGSPVCPSLRVSAVRAGGTTDVTHSVALGWMSTSANERRYQDGLPVKDASGNPCFTVVQPGTWEIQVTYGAEAFAKIPFTVNP